MKPIVGIILLIVLCGGVPVVNAAAAPVAVDDDSCYCMWEDGFYISDWGPGLLDNDFDPAGLPLSAELVSEPSHGSLPYFYSDGRFAYETRMMAPNHTKCDKNLHISCPPDPSEGR